MKSHECPECGKVTNQMLRGFKDGGYTYRCGHCNKKYTVKESKEDVILSSQLGFKINEKEDLHRIAVEVHRSKHGSFLKAFAAAYMRADQQNKALLRPTWLNLIEEYELDKEYKIKR